MLKALLVYVMLAAFVAPSAAFADTPGGVRGTVIDATGRPMPGVAVELTSLNGSERRTLRTDGHGFFGVLGLAPGRYAATVHVVGRGASCSVEDIETGEVRTFRIVVASSAGETTCIAQRPSGSIFDPDETADVYRIH